MSDLLPHRAHRAASLAFSIGTCATLTACVGLSNTMPGLDHRPRFSPDDFDNASVHTRHLAVPQINACEAARRALLSQGYLVNTATSELVAGRKYFQPSTETHYEVEMRVVCAPEGSQQERTAAFASALQDRYVIKKINNSASLGVGALGSVSLPVSASDEALVKVGSETVTDAKFYEGFFRLLDLHIKPAVQTAPPLSPASSASQPQLQAPKP